MRRIQCALLATVAAIGFASVASAADMPVKARPMAPAVYDWSGIYFGVDAGWQSSSIGLSNPDFGTLSYSPRHSSFAFGAFGGVQRQFDQFVLGVEGGYLAATGDASLGTTPAISIFVPGLTGTAQAKLKDIWSVGVRAGLAIDRWMPYLTGGWASGAFRFNAQNVVPAVGTEQADSRNGGYYIGGGVDWAVWNNWILGLEYRHYGFRANTVASSTTGLAGFSENVRFSPNTDTVLARLSYKFDWKW